MDDAIGPFMWAPITQDASSSPTPALAARSSATPALIATSPAWNVCFHPPPLRPPSTSRCVALKRRPSPRTGRAVPSLLHESAGEGLHCGAGVESQ